MSNRTLTAILIGCLAPADAFCDEVLYRYEGDVRPYDESAGWIIADACGDLPGACSASVADDHFVLHWDEYGELVNYHLWIARAGETPPPTLWVEWSFRSNQPLGNNATCDGRFWVYRDGVGEPIMLFGDAAVSFEGGDVAAGLAMSDFHTYRFESLDDANYGVAVDGLTFIRGTGSAGTGAHFVQLGGRGGCSLDLLPTVNEWDFVRYGTISYGEHVITSNPPSGFLTAGKHPNLDRFTVTFDSPNYVYLDEITVEVSGGETPIVLQTRRLNNGDPETIEIILDRPIPPGEHTRFIFNDGVAENVVDYSYLLGDSDGNGRIDLRDAATFQNCFGQTPVADACRAVDFDGDDAVNQADQSWFVGAMTGP